MGRRPLSLRLRLIVSATAAVAIAVVLSAAGAYLTTRHELRHEVDLNLSRVARQFGLRLPRFPGGIGPGGIGGGFGPAGLGVVRFPARLGGRVGEIQVIGSDGVPLGPPVLRVTNADRNVAAGSAERTFHDARVDGTHLRVVTEALPGGGAVQLAQALTPVDATLQRLVNLLALLVLGGIALAATLGTLVARAALRPVKHLTEEAERVAATRDLSAAIEVHGADEVARLASTLNALLAAVDASQREQRRLVADASHELRTPLTSLRTNLELLARSPAMPAADRQAILAELVDQVGELSSLVGALVELDSSDGSRAAEPALPVAFDEVVASAVSRMRRQLPGVVFSSSALEPTIVMGREGELERAVVNLLDNAAKWSPPGAMVEVALSGGVLRVRDQGPGIDPSDIPHVFERFYRSAAARSLPGSGLGLAIVAQVAADHRGRAWVEPAPGGGTVAYLSLPTISADAASEGAGEHAVQH